MSLCCSREFFFGSFVLGLVGFLWVWYTLWMVVTPLVDASHWLHEWFPDRYWGMAVPMSFGVTALSFASGVYIRFMIMQ